MRVLPIHVSSFACAVACAVALPAAAQSSVKIGGMIDVGVYRDSNQKWNVGTIQRSNLAFSGTEELGGGLTAFFKLSTRFDIDTGALEDSPAKNKPFWHDESTVGLKGGFGSIKFGRALDAMYANDWNFDPWYYFNRVASPAWDLWHYNYPSDPRANGGTAEYGRIDNGIYYDSPVIGGASLHLSGSPERRTTDTRRPLGGALKYAAGPLLAMVAHEKNADAATDTFIGLKGKFTSFAVMGAYDVSKTPNNTSKAKTLTLGAQYFVGPWTLNAGWGQVDLDGTKVQKNVAVGGLYALSKRTYVYSDYSHKSYVNRNANVYGLGITHTF
jgi:predicted porin